MTQPKPSSKDVMLTRYTEPTSLVHLKNHSALLCEMPSFRLLWISSNPAQETKSPPPVLEPERETPSPSSMRPWTSTTRQTRHRMCQPCQRRSCPLKVPDTLEYASSSRFALAPIVDVVVGYVCAFHGILFSSPALGLRPRLTGLRLATVATS